MTEKEIKDLVKEEVLRFLPAKSLTRFKAVSKGWQRQIQNPLLQIHQSYHFNKLSGFFLQNKYDSVSFISLDHSSYGVPRRDLSFIRSTISIVGSSNGFLLCRCRINGTLYVCNPVTLKFCILPEAETLFLHDEAASVLGFEPSGLNMECHYHVVTAIKPADMQFVIFETYASKRGTWEQALTIPLDEDETTTSKFTGNTFYFKGIAYWEVTTKKVVAFDVKNMEGEVISLPEEISEKGAFGEIKGEICYLCILSSVLKIYNLAQREWQREIVLGIDQSLGWILPGFDGKTVMIHSGRSIYSCCLGDDDEDKFRKLVDVPFELDFDDKRSYFGYVNTFAHIK